jgi:integrase
MPRRSQGPRLYLDPRRDQWVIRDGENFVRTGCARSDNEGAEKKLAEYIAGKYRPTPSPSPLIADVLLVYAKERLPKTKAAAKAAHNISNLKRFWGQKKAADINADSCNEFAATRPKVAGRRDMEVLRAALLYWHKHYGPLDRLPHVLLPDKPGRRERVLSKEETKRLRKASMEQPHLYRFVILGLRTGSRSGVLFNLKWDWIDLEHGIMNRIAPGEIEDATKKAPPVRLARAVVRLMRLWKRRDTGVSEYVIHYQGDPVTKLRRSWATACKTAKIVGASPHTLRHTRATRLMQEGIDLWEASGSLGMSVRTLETTYAKHHPDFQSNAAEVD